MHHPATIYPLPPKRGLPTDFSAPPLPKRLCNFHRPRNLLSLPGELRNQIYRYVLLSDRSFPVQIQFAPLHTAFLRVNKQMYFEASDIFYCENTFRFPAALFAGPPIVWQIMNFYHLPLAKLQTIRSVVLDIPVCFLRGCLPIHRLIFIIQIYAATNNKLRDQVTQNLRRLINFLKAQNYSDLQVQLRFQYPWGEKTSEDHPESYWDPLDSVRCLVGRIKDFHVSVGLLHPVSLDPFVDWLVSIKHHGFLSPF